VKVSVRIPNQHIERISRLRFVGRGGLRNGNSSTPMQRFGTGSIAGRNFPMIRCARGKRASTPSHRGPIARLFQLMMLWTAPPPGPRAGGARVRRCSTDCTTTGRPKRDAQQKSRWFPPFCTFLHGRAVGRKRPLTASQLPELGQQGANSSNLLQINRLIMPVGVELCAPHLVHALVLRATEAHGCKWRGRIEQIRETARFTCILYRSLCP
jgi:hypothetical protein